MIYLFVVPVATFAIVYGVILFFRGLRHKPSPQFDEVSTTSVDTSLAISLLPTEPPPEVTVQRVPLPTPDSPLAEEVTPTKEVVSPPLDEEPTLADPGLPERVIKRHDDFTAPPVVVSKRRRKKSDG